MDAETRTRIRFAVDRRRRIRLGLRQQSLVVAERRKTAPLFPDEASCLNWLWRNHYSKDGIHAYCPKCDREREFKRYDTKQARRSWTCLGCGHHIHPTVGTIFYNSELPLRTWFYAIDLLKDNAVNITTKKLERELGCSYKTARRIRRLITAS